MMPQRKFLKGLLDEEKIKSSINPKTTILQNLEMIQKFAYNDNPQHLKGKNLKDINPKKVVEEDYYDSDFLKCIYSDCLEIMPQDCQLITYTMAYPLVSLHDPNQKEKLLKKKEELL